MYQHCPNPFAIKRRWKSVDLSLKSFFVPRNNFLLNISFYQLAMFAPWRTQSSLRKHGYPSCTRGNASESERATRTQNNNTQKRKMLGSLWLSLGATESQIRRICLKFFLFCELFSFWRHQFLKLFLKYQNYKRDRVLQGDAGHAPLTKSPITK